MFGVLGTQVVCGESGGLDVTTMERFMAKVKSGDGCWEWQATVNRPQSRHSSRGYGRFSLSGRDRVAHVVAYEMFVGPVPPGMRVLHECDNPPCVRPDHLKLGTQRQNCLDASARGRLRGRRGPKKVSAEQEQQMLALRRAGRSQSQIAKVVGLSQTGVSAALRRLGCWERKQCNASPVIKSAA